MFKPIAEILYKIVYIQACVNLELQVGEHALSVMR